MAGRKLLFFSVSFFFVLLMQNQLVAQDKEELAKFEVGGHFTNFSFGNFDPALVDEFSQITGVPRRFRDLTQNEAGFGARFTYNFNKNIAVESEFNFYPRNRKEVRYLSPGVPPFQGGQKFQVLFGPKIGYRGKKFGIFGKARPGLIRFTDYPVITELIFLVQRGQLPILGRQTSKSANFFNVDIGGVFEYYPTSKTIFRVDVGDTIIRYNAQKPKDINPSFTRHNLQVNIGFGFRF